MKELWLTVHHTVNMRAPTKLLGDCHVIDSQCCRLTLSLMAVTGVIENFESMSYMPTRTDVIEFGKRDTLQSREGEVTFVKQVVKSLPRTGTLLAGMRIYPISYTMHLLFALLCKSVQET